MGKRGKSSQLFFGKTNDFLENYLSKQSGRSENTVKTYKINLGTFFDYIISLGQSPMEFMIADCTYEFLLNYSQFLQEKYSISTVNQKIATIKTYLKYVADCDLSYMQVYLAAKDIPALKKIKTQAEVIEPQILEALLNAPKNTAFGNRDRLVLILLFDLGIRASELTSIKLGDIKITSGGAEVKIHGKGRKERRITLSVKSREHLKLYLRTNHPEPDPKRYLFYSKSRGAYVKMTVRNIERIVKKYGDIVKDEKANTLNIHPHLLRHTRATYLYKDGVPLNMISTLLGHEQLETTRIYVTTTADQIREIIDNTSKHEVDGKTSTPLLWRGHEDELKRKFGLK